jgi:hypothetical protein
MYYNRGGHLIVAKTSCIMNVMKANSILIIVDEATGLDRLYLVNQERELITSCKDSYF